MSKLMSTFCVDNAVFLNSQTLLKPPAATREKRNKFIHGQGLKTQLRLNF
jgi:hypothetical protein